jgi:hypothetical protein
MSVISGISSNPSSRPHIGQRGKITMHRMPALVVLEHLEGCMQTQPSAPAHACQSPLERSLGLSGVKHTLRHGVLPTVVLPTHPELHAVPGQELPIAVGAILTATVRMHDAPRRGLALTDIAQISRPLNPAPSARLCCLDRVMYLIGVGMIDSATRLRSVDVRGCIPGAPRSALELSIAQVKWPLPAA